jgi:hypothetical protein
VSVAECNHKHTFCSGGPVAFWSLFVALCSGCGRALIVATSCVPLEFSALAVISLKANLV